jgi:hypothetical protein
VTDDDDLRARLRGADPAASLPPLAPTTVERLLGETMTTTTTTATAAPARWRRVALATAAALVLIAGGASYLLTQPGDPTSHDAYAPERSIPTVTNLTVTGASAKCRAPEPAFLAASADFAFAGRVTGIAGSVVTLQVAHVYRGTATEEVRVAQQGEVSETLLGSGKFEVGKDYLVASTHGQLMICGYSGEADTPGLRELFDRAF